MKRRRSVVAKYVSALIYNTGGSNRDITIGSTDDDFMALFITCEVDTWFWNILIKV